MIDVVEPSKLFGSRVRTEVLLLIAILEETYASELAAISQRRLYSVQRVVEALEREGIVVGRVSGRERRLVINPRLPFRKELLALLVRMMVQEQSLMETINSMRRLPRRKGKQL
ncbi:MAG: hypothetical protein KIT74_03280 [Fimbriimonadales bacterium]|nr:hypothetical protein [Fimbriimonadales bacterium]